MPDEATPTATTPLTKPWWALWRWPLHWQIALAVVLGISIGILMGRQAMSGPSDTARSALVNSWPYLGFKLIADMFMNGLRMLIVPLVATAIITAVASIGRQQGFARLGAKTVLYYLSTSAIAVVIGLVLVASIQPGVTADGTPLLTTESDLTGFAAEITQLEGRTEGRGLASFLDVFRQLVPDNIVKAAVESSMLGLILFSLLVGFFTSRLEGESGDTLRRFFQGAYMVMLGITDLVLRFAGPGVLALLVVTVSEQWIALAGADRFQELGYAVALFTGTVAGALALHVFIVLPLILMFVGRVKPWRHFAAMAPALLTAFSSASSAATLPLTIDCVEKRAGVSNRVGSFVLPLGATVNMDGTALYECVAVLFIAQLYGIELTIAQQILVVLISLATSVGVAGVPAASLVAIVVILNAVGVPMEGLAIILVVDRVLDMCRTSVNIFSDSCGAVVIARSEGEGVLGEPARVP